MTGGFVKVQLWHGDCLTRMAGLEEGSIGGVICDPPYGLEFMGKSWDRLDWQAGGGFSKPGIGERQTSWPSFSATSVHGAANPTCEVCGGRLRGANKCSCPKPHDHWKPVGERRKAGRLDGVGTGGAKFTQDGMNKGFKALPSYSGSPNPLCRNCGGSKRGQDRKGFRVCRCDNPDFPLIGREQGQGMQEWHHHWLVEVFRVLSPGGLIKTFGGTRVFHRLAAAMETAGFEDIHIEALGYGSGFPKSHNIAVYMDRMLTEGRSREIIRKGVGNLNGRFADAAVDFVSQSKAHTVTTPEALPWVGWGTALKPAWEPVLVGRKP